MHKLKTLWSALSPRVFEELETWTQVLLALGAAVLLFMTLKAQAAHAGAPLTAAAARPETTMAAGAGSARWQEQDGHELLARRMPLETSWPRRSS